MPEISLFEPQTLLGVVEKLPVADNLTLLKRFPRVPHPFPTASWDVIKGTRQVARPNVPNSEAHIVARQGRSRETASFIYLREKKVFEPTTLHWLRAPGTLSNKENAEKSAMRELRDLNVRFDNFMEWACWQAMFGEIVLNYDDVVSTVDFKFPDSHRVSVGTSWATATPEQIIDNVTAWKRLVERDGKVAAREAYVTDVTMSRIYRSFAGSSLISDRAKDEYYKSGTLPGFLQIDWKVVNGSYETDDGATAMFLPDDAIVMGDFSTNRPIEILEGPTADDDAPNGHTGRFSKSWKEKDPSARQILLEHYFLPVVTRPEQIVVVEDVAP